MTTIPLITTIPSNPPSTSDPTNFDTEADAFLGDFPAMNVEQNAMATAMNTVRGEMAVFAAAAEAAKSVSEASAAAAAAATTYFATSVSTIALTAGTKTVNSVQSGRAFAADDDVVLIVRTDTSVRLFGTVATAVGQAYTVVVPADGIQGTGGPYSDWMMIHAAFLGVGATVAELRAGTSPNLAVTPAALSGVSAFTTKADAATITWTPVSDGLNITTTFGGNRTLTADFTGLWDGAPLAWEYVQDGTGTRIPAHDSAKFDFGAAGTPTFQTAAGKRDIAFGVYRSATGKAHMNFRKGA